MGDFSITFTGEFSDRDPQVAIGELILGDDHQHFSSVLGFWGPGDYERSWASGLMRLVEGAPISCLATSVTDPSTANFVEVWPLYREGDDVYAQNRLLFMDQLPNGFDPAAPWESVTERV